MRRWPVAGVTGLGALAVFGAAATPAAALTPSRTAWWNEAPLGLVVSPSPVQPDQLMVAEGTASPGAVAAVYYSVADSQAAGDASSVSATLRMPLDTSSSVGTPAVEACPIQPAAAGWHKGGAQTGSPPAYDCANGKGVAGQLSSDGSSLLFTLTPAQQQAGSPGVFDLELIPASATPFQTVFDQPGNGDFTVTAPSSPTGATSAPGAGGAPAPGGASAPAGGGQGSGAPSGPDTSGGGSGFVGSSPDLGAGDLGSAPALSAPAAPSASPAAGTSGSASTASSGGGARVAAGALRPVASSGGPGGGWLGGRRKQVFGVWLLVDVGLVLFLFGSELERAPQLLGSVAARRGAGRVEAEADEGAAVGEVRGIGRFARVRTEPARRLY
ncbi:MAG TPA: hypothetical protein VFH50_08720 [Acidimicrobiales bacterium]|nr:hypothetical protein [Acidimicrobiales bacterium]